jgi:hypothetical protein
MLVTIQFQYLSVRLLSRNVKIKIYEIPILLVALYGCETWCITRKKQIEGVSQQGAEENI